jgi:hypothetical protein
MAVVFLGFPFEHQRASLEWGKDYPKAAPLARSDDRERYRPAILLGPSFLQPKWDETKPKPIGLPPESYQMCGPAHEAKLKALMALAETCFQRARAVNFSRTVMLACDFNANNPLWSLSGEPTGTATTALTTWDPDAIRDTWRTGDAVEVTWQWLTFAKATKTTDGFLLQQSGESLTLTAVGSSKLKFEAEDVSAPRHAFDSPNPNLLRLLIRLQTPSESDGWIEVAANPNPN